MGSERFDIEAKPDFAGGGPSPEELSVMFPVRVNKNETPGVKV